MKCSIQTLNMLAKLFPSMTIVELMELVKENKIQL